MSLYEEKNFCLFKEEEILTEILEEEEEEEKWVYNDDLEEDKKSIKSSGQEDSIKIYFKEVFSYKLLTREDEIRIGMTIEENEKTILKESLNYYSQIIKFYHLLMKAEKNRSFILLFKNCDKFLKETEKAKIWLNELKTKVNKLLENFKKKKEKLIDEIIELIFEVRPTKVLLKELSCEIVEGYNKLTKIKKELKKNYLLEDEILEKILFLNGNLDNILKEFEKFSVEKIVIEKIKKEINKYQFLNQLNDYFGESVDKIYKSGEIICKAFQEIKKNKEELVKANLRLIVSLARKYASKGVCLNELIQEGNIGLLKAIERFDYRKGFKFSSYATWWIKQSMIKYLAENTRTIRIPVHIIEIMHKISKIISKKFYQEYGREPTLEELAKESGQSIEKLNYIFKIMKHPVSLEKTIGEDEDTTLMDFIEDHDTIKPEEATFNIALSEKVRDLLKTLSPREEKIIRLRFGIGEKEAYTLEEVGNKFGVTKERIRQIESLALRKLKHPNRIKLLKNFLVNDF